MSHVMLDTGPLVALLQESDQRHEWMRETLAALRKPLYTCEAVVVEAAYLVRRLTGGREAVLGLLASDVLTIEFRLATELRAVHSLVERYRSVPMSIADACLVRMTEIVPDSRVLTFDSDFRIYRRGGRHAIPVIMPGRH